MDGGAVVVVLVAVVEMMMMMMRRRRRRRRNRRSKRSAVLVIRMLTWVEGRDSRMLAQDKAPRQAEARQHRDPWLSA